VGRERQIEGGRRQRGRKRERGRGGTGRGGGYEKPHPGDQDASHQRVFIF